jgi:hypothetical protein
MARIRAWLIKLLVGDGFVLYNVVFDVQPGYVSIQTLGGYEVRRIMTGPAPEQKATEYVN